MIKRALILGVKPLWGLTPILFLLAGCSSGTTYAPVASISKPQVPSSGTYRVSVGDTLYSIAWAYAMDYRQLAALNNLRPPYSLYPGEIIRLAGAVREIKREPKTQRVVVRREPVRQVALPDMPNPVHRWNWPAQGKLAERFSNTYSGNPGINISGAYGEPVRATANGIVVYSGTGVRGYGNLIIVKHNNSYLSAYAFNKVNLVRQGTRVKAGQVIAEMGRNDAGSVLLHFEIRRNGKPVNPLRYLS